MKWRETKRVAEIRGGGGGGACRPLSPSMHPSMVHFIFILRNIFSEKQSCKRGQKYLLLNLIEAKNTTTQ